MWIFCLVIGEVAFGAAEHRLLKHKEPTPGEGLVFAGYLITGAILLAAATLA